MDGYFFAMMFRMKYINRWGLMRLLHSENLSEHSMECCILAHALAVIGNKIFNKNYNPERIALKAVYHDAPEILTGDTPTPIKYYNDATKETYNLVEKNAIDKFLSLLPDEIKEEYNDIFIYTTDEKKIIKAADKLCAYIKCLDETNAGNHEFKSALVSTKGRLEAMKCEELDYFMDNCISSFTKSLDELQNKI